MLLKLEAKKQSILPLKSLQRPPPSHGVFVFAVIR